MTSSEAAAIVVDQIHELSAARRERDVWRQLALVALALLHEAEHHAKCRETRIRQLLAELRRLRASTRVAA